MPNKLSNAVLEWSEDNKPRSNIYNDIYFSTADACGEAEYVFIEKNNLKQRWLNENNLHFIIGECGFGSGLNFLSACKLWNDTAKPDTSLHYIACEKHPLRKEDLARLHTQWPHLSQISEALIEHYPDHTEGIHRLHFNVDSKEITLDLLYGDANETLKSIYQANGIRVDAWFLDGFSPQLNPAMWSQNLFQAIAKLSKAGTTLSTYSVAGDIRRGLATMGFAVRKEEGFGRKRHMLCATFYSPEQTTTSSSTPWFNLPKNIHQQKNVTIIGAGLAGCSSAYALANKGWKVTLIERQEKIAGMASGNPQGIVHCKISQQLNASSEFIQLAYLYAIRQYQTLNQQHNFNWHQCGMLQMAYNSKEEEKQNKIISSNIYSKKLLQAFTASQNNTIANIKTNMSGLFFPDSGWLNPKLLCQSYCQHPNIKVLLHTEAIELKKSNNQWHIRNTDTEISQCEIVIIANSIDANKLAPSTRYPLIPNRGQVDFYKSSPKSLALKTILCSNAYIIPAFTGTHSIGGSFTPDSTDNEVLQTDQENNLGLIKNLLPDCYEDFRAQPSPAGRAAIRCSTPDYLPIVGPVENHATNSTIYKELSLNARKKIDSQPDYESGLFINIAHGSHALTTTPLASEYIAALLNNEPLPIQNEVANCIHPMRFLIRDLKKQK